MDKILTIAIPTYNMESFIARCLDSLLVNDGLEYLQILVINDGSKDRSSEIAHNYAQKFPDSIFVVDKDNGNYGSCVNLALQYATGKYIKILDADDYFHTENLEKLIKRLIRCKTDVILTNHTIRISNRTHLWKHNYHDNQIINLELECPTYFSMHSIIYSVSLLRGMCYRQTEGISYTDQEWIFYPILNASNMQYLDLDIYQYCMDREGQTMDPAVFAKGLPMLYTIFFRALAYRKEIIFNKLQAQIEYCDLQLYRQAQIIYKQELVHNPVVSVQLGDLDLKIKELAPNLYSKLNCSHIGFHKYVKRYRKTGQGLSILDKFTLPLQCKIMNFILKLRYNIKRINK